MIRLRKNRYSPSWVDAVPSVGSNSSEEMPGGHDESDALAEGGGGGARAENNPFRQRKRPSAQLGHRLLRWLPCLMLLSGQTEYGSRRGRCSGRREPATLPRSRAAELPGKLFDAAEAIPGRARRLHTGRKSRARRSQESRLLFEQIGGVPVVEHERAFHSRLRAFHRADQADRGGRRRRWGILLEKRIRDWSWRTSRVGGIERLWTRTRRAWKGYQTTSEHAIIRRRPRQE